MEWTIIKVPFSTDVTDDLVKRQGPDLLCKDYNSDFTKTVATLDPNLGGWITLSRELVELSGERPLWIAGECTVAPGAFGWLQRRISPLHIIWLDAHGDLNTPDTSMSGNLAGMPLGWILGRFTPLEGVNVLEPIAPENVTLFGVRDLDPNEVEYIQNQRIFMASKVSEVIKRVSKLGHPVYMHIDLDALNPKENPAVSIPVKGGISVQQLVTLLETLVNGKWLAGVSLASYNFKNDAHRRGELAISRIFQTLGIDGLGV
ncbi:hypothetical protein AR454_21790 [Bacillus mycoides]|uniref:arginase family protein n=1 Tax=Bacillus mycoides TaxID=1405 RepID=UPI001E45E957|nr:arginase family protein [Bacillus mycoides]MCD4644871.1 hypothetical protein [Bacillus mycoides]